MSETYTETQMRDHAENPSTDKTSAAMIMQLLWALQEEKGQRMKEAYIAGGEAGVILARTKRGIAT